jgi:hypothetical protein
MKALIERQLSRPPLAVPLVALTQLMISVDFNLLQVSLIMFVKGVQYIFYLALHRHGARVRPSDGPIAATLPASSRCAGT